jgi:tripartite-type tricarboxylate transporter receptor subunit TctC
VALSQPEVAKRMASVGIEPRLMSPEEFGDYIKMETAKWADVIKRSGAKAD